MNDKMPEKTEEEVEKTIQQVTEETMILRDIIGESIPEGTSVTVVIVAMVSLISGIMKDGGFTIQEANDLKEYILGECIH